MPDKTFTVAEARALLPELRERLFHVRRHRSELLKLGPAVQPARAAAEFDGGTPYGEVYVRHAIEFATAYDEITDTGAIVKDVRAGLVDFPHEHEGRIVYLCWKLGEDDLAWWHEVEDGFGGRRPLADGIE